MDITLPEPRTAEEVLLYNLCANGMGGGTLTAVNEYENAVPTTINYIAETAGA